MSRNLFNKRGNDPVSVRLRSRGVRLRCAGLASALLSSTVFVVATVADTAGAASGDGTSASTAGASCWGIKQAFPGATSGVYYVQTPALVEPRQVYCDMETDGGGWVLVGRGMQGWEWSPAGQNSANVAAAPDGLRPAALPTSMINGLLNGTSVSSLPDGVRLRRAASPDGAAYQEVRMSLGLGAWSWSMPQGFPITRLTVDGTVISPAGTTRDTLGDNGVDTQIGVAGSGLNDQRRIWTTTTTNDTKTMGFGMGSAAGTGPMWHNPTGTPVPFTQVYLRPRIGNNVSYSRLATRAPSNQLPLALRNSSELNPWGVSGQDLTGQISSADPAKATVYALAESRNRMFVGGSFTQVKNGPNANGINRRFLAAFDLNGNWISSFTPNVNGRVWDMLPSPDGKLFIAGDFTSVNGDTQAAGIAKIDPITGAVDTSFRAKVSLNGARGLVRAIDLRGTTLYLGGRFDAIQIGGTDRPVANTASVHAATAALLPWRPRTNGVVFDIDASAKGDRVYLAGWFTSINGVNDLTYATSATDGSLLSNFKWIRSYGTGLTCCSGRYTQTVKEVGNLIYLTHREHLISVFDRTTGVRVQTFEAVRNGDHQASVVFDNKIWIACHCGDWDYQGAVKYPLDSVWQRRGRINLVGQYDALTAEKMDGFLPSLASGTGDGAWRLLFDSRQCLWAGGDLDRRAWTGDAATDYVGEFLRFCPDVDRTVPSRPPWHTATPTADGSVNLAWGGSTDASNDVHYLVYRDGKVIDVVYGATRYTDRTPGQGSHQYAVQAADAAGNRSESTVPVDVAVGRPAVIKVIAANETWKWTYPPAASAPPVGWTGLSFNDGNWSSGAAQLGYGDGDEATLIPGGSNPRNVTAYFRKSLTLANPTAYRYIVVSVTRDDGVVLYINGVEVGRESMPLGPIGPTTRASVAQDTTAQESGQVTFLVPASKLSSGTNVIAAEIHQSDPASNDLSFQLEAIMMP